jgi:hypothetical protein
MISLDPACYCLWIKAQQPPISDQTLRRAQVTQSAVPSHQCVSISLIVEQGMRLHINEQAPFRKLLQRLSESLQAS